MFHSTIHQKFKKICYYSWLCFARSNIKASVLSPSKNPSLPIKTNQLRHYFISLIKRPGVRFGQGDMPESQLNSFSIVLLSPLMLSWNISFIFGLPTLPDFRIHERNLCASVKYVLSHPYFLSFLYWRDEFASHATEESRT